MRSVESSFAITVLCVVASILSRAFTTSRNLMSLLTVDIMFIHTIEIN